MGVIEFVGLAFSSMRRSAFSCSPLRLGTFAGRSLGWSWWSSASSSRATRPSGNTLYIRDIENAMARLRMPGNID